MGRTVFLQLGVIPVAIQSSSFLVSAQRRAEMRKEGNFLSLVSTGKLLEELGHPCRETACNAASRRLTVCRLGSGKQHAERNQHNCKTT